MTLTYFPLKKMLMLKRKSQDRSASGQKYENSYFQKNSQRGCMHACICDPVCFNQIAYMFHSFVHSFIQQVFTDLYARNSWDGSAYQIVFNCYEVKIFLKTEK